MRKRIALINQRYGLEVNGGSEYYSRLIAERLLDHYQVDVLTSKAVSYEKWTNYYDNDIEEINGVVVRRFPVCQKRRSIALHLIGNMIIKLHMNWKWLCNFWVKAQGPDVPDLIRYIKQHKDYYTAFIFITYLYYPSVFGMPEVKDKAIFVPTAHNEPYIHFRSHTVLFKCPKAIIYLTDEEKELVTKLFHNEDIPSIVAGVGVDIPEKVDNTSFRRKYGITESYLIYTGRVDQGKGCQDMFDYFLQYQQEMMPDTILIVMGKKYMDIPQTPYIRYLGFVSEEDKYNGVVGAKALWLPSKYESLSISVLEAMAMGVPVLVNGKCDVLKGHCRKSGGGMYYADYKSLRNALNTILGDPAILAQMGSRAKKYVKDNYCWPQIIRKIENIIEEVGEA